MHFHLYFCLLCALAFISLDSADASHSSPSHSHAKRSFVKKRALDDIAGLKAARNGKNHTGASSSSDTQSGITSPSSSKREPTVSPDSLSDCSPLDPGCSAGSSSSHIKSRSHQLTAPPSSTPTDDPSGAGAASSCNIVQHLLDPNCQSSTQASSASRKHQAPSAAPTDPPTTTRSKHVAPSESSSDCGVLGFLTGCSSGPSSTPSSNPNDPGSSPSPSPSSRSRHRGSSSAPPAPTSSVDCGLLDNLLDPSCPSSSAAATPASSSSDPSGDPGAATPTPTPTSSCGLLDGLLNPDCPSSSASSTPTPTPGKPGESATPTPSPSPSQSCGLVDGLLDPNCNAPSSTPTPGKPGTSATPSPSPSQNCGLVDGLLDPNCNAPSSTPSGSPTGANPSQTPTTTSASCGLVDGLLDPNCQPTASSSLPDNNGATSSVSASASGSSSSTGITFPTGSNRSSSTTATNTDSNQATQTVNSEFSFLTQPTLVVASSTDGTSDQSTTSLTLNTGTSTASPTVAPLPSNIPARIYPAVELDPNADMSSSALISILFDASLNWQFEATTADAPAQLFAYFPTAISNAIGINAGSVQTLYLQAFVPDTYQGPQDVEQLRTLYMGYIPIDTVDMLAAQIKAKSSPFYTMTTGISNELAMHVDSSFAINTVSDPNASTDGSGTGGTNGSSGSSSKTRQDAIIGVVSALGALAVLILGFLIHRSWKRRQEFAHRRLSDPDRVAVGARPEGQEFDRDSLGGQRRRSFYYAEDSLIGAQGGGDERYDYHASPDNGMRERRQIVPGTISSPYLQQSSMNW